MADYDNDPLMIPLGAEARSYIGPELIRLRARVAELEAEPDLAAAEQIADRALRFNAEYPEDRAVVVIAALARAGMLRRALDAVPAASAAPRCPNQGIGDHDCVEHADTWPPSD